jgi:hypothetical protein
MTRPWLRALLLSPCVLLMACHDSNDVTGPDSTSYVHVSVANDSSASIWIPAAAGGSVELSPGSKGELPFVRPESIGGGFAVARPLATNLGEVSFDFARPPASKAGLNYATIHVTANPGSQVVATSDRPALVVVTGVAPPR